jgi:hypothetical protein
VNAFEGGSFPIRCFNCTPFGTVSLKVEINEQTHSDNVILELLHKQNGDRF